MISIFSRRSLLSCRKLPRRPPSQFFVSTQPPAFTGGLPHVPTLRERLARSVPTPTIFSAVKTPTSWKHVLVAAISGYLLYSVAASTTNEVTDHYAAILRDHPDILGLGTSKDVRQARHKSIFITLRDTADDLAKFAETRALPPVIKRVMRSTYIWSANHWIAASDGARMAYLINTVNLGVFILWHVPRMRPFMQRHFVHTPLSGRTHTLITSVFSHRSFWHLATNAVFLTAFANTASIWLAVEQMRLTQSTVPEATSSYHFLAVYLIGGVAANIFSHIAHARLIYPRLVKRLSAAAANTATAATGASVKTKLSLRTRLAVFFRGPSVLNAPPAPPRDITGSWGATGAICALFSLTALAFPSGSISFVFLTDYPVDLRLGFVGFVLFELLGVVRGWRRFDHFAHLGGILFGAAYAYYGMHAWNILRAVHKIAAQQMAEQRKKEREEHGGGGKGQSAESGAHEQHKTEEATGGKTETETKTREVAGEASERSDDSPKGTGT